MVDWNNSVPAKDSLMMAAAMDLWRGRDSVRLFPFVVTFCDRPTGMNARVRNSYGYIWANGPVESCAIMR